jgi:hypothetical protein
MLRRSSGDANAALGHHPDGIEVQDLRVAAGAASLHGAARSGL